MPRVSLKFSLLSSREVERRSRLRVIHPHLHGSGGVLDRRLATSDGHVRLELPVYHIGYLAQTLAVLGRVCKTCSAADPGPVCSSCRAANGVVHRYPSSGGIKVIHEWKVNGARQSEELSPLRALSIFERISDDHCARLLSRHGRPEDLCAF